jgi:hypothetical protein
MQVGLHDHREQRLINPPAALQQAGEERPSAQLGDAQLQIPSRRGQHPWPVAVALGQPLGCPLVGGGTDHRGELGLDQGLVDGLGGLADAVVDLCGRECVQDLQQCRLVKGHRALCPFARTIGLVSLTIARWPLCHGNYAITALLPTPLPGTPLETRANFGETGQMRGLPYQGQSAGGATCCSVPHGS